MEMDECKKYEKCSATLCPLDKDLGKRNYIDGDPICFYMREHVKGNRGASVHDKTIHRMIELKRPLIQKLGKSAFKKKLKEAESSPSKRDTENLVANLSTIPVVNAVEGSIRGGDTEKEGVFNAMIHLYSKASVQPKDLGSSLRP